ncbi:MAG TPA: TonB-dependent receptor [Acidisarcina sp.]|nr:TonB-dependent receptor [Acidisarcina sp.]
MRIHQRHIVRSLFFCALALLAGIPASSAHAAIVRGTVTDPLGAPVARAEVALVANGAVLTSATTGPDGSYQLTTPEAGRFYVVVAGRTFHQMTTAGFYAGRLDAVEQNIVLEPEWVRQEIVVTATGTPLPQEQVSSSVTLIPRAGFETHSDLVDTLRQVPGTSVVQSGQRGSATSLFVRGGNSDANKVTYDGVTAEDIGGRFDYGSVSTNGISSLEAYRGPNSVLYGSDAASGVVDLATPRGTTATPSIFYAGDAGNFSTYRNEVQLAGARGKADYYGAFSRLNTSNSLPMDKYHVATAAANLGWQPSAATQLRVTAHNSVSATGLPGAYDFYLLANDGKQSDQDTYVGATVENQTSPAWHNLARYGLARKREQSVQWYPAGILTQSGGAYPTSNYYGLPVTIHGANGYAVSGQALLNYTTDNFGVYPNRFDFVSNRDQLYAQSDYRFGPHMVGLVGFRFENERGSERSSAYFIDQSLERTNYDYTAQIQGDLRNRLFYTLGGSLLKNELYGTETNPRIGLAYYVVRPGPRIFRGTKVKFNFAKGVKEPTLTEQFGSLYAFLASQPGGSAAIQSFHISRIGAERARSYDGGVEQNLFGQRVLLRVTYFHNEFGNQIESVTPGVIPQLLPNLTAAQQQQLEALLQNTYSSLNLNSLDFRAQGLEAETEYSIGRRIFLRGGYTYLDAKVQRSFSSSSLYPTYNTGLSTGPVPSFSNVPIGAYSPLTGARPFRRPPHTGFASASYTSGKWSAQVLGAFASRSDDSTFLAYSDIEQGNSLLLPNRNLDPGFAKIDLGGSYQVLPWVGIYAQLDNLLSDQHLAPIGYQSLPLSFRTGIRLALGKGMTK